MLDLEKEVVFWYRVFTILFYIKGFKGYQAHLFKSNNYNIKMKTLTKEQVYFFTTFSLSEVDQG